MTLHASINTLIVCTVAYYYPQYRNLIQRVIKQYLANAAGTSEPTFRAESKDGMQLDLQEYYQTVFAPQADKLTSDRKNEPRTRTPEPKVTDSPERMALTPIHNSRGQPELYREK